MDTTSTAKSVISSDRIEGTSVYDTSGEKLGSIEPRLPPTAPCPGLAARHDLGRAARPPVEHPG